MNIKNAAAFIAALLLPMCFLIAQFNEKHPTLTFIFTLLIWLAASYIATGWKKPRQTWALWAVVIGVIEASALIWMV